MPNAKRFDAILNRVDPSRREFVRRVLACTAFAAPVVTTFSIGSLATDTALAQSGACITGTPSTPLSYVSGQCISDTGYVGPSGFQAHVEDVSGNTRVNGEVFINVFPNSTAAITLQMVKNAQVRLAYLAINCADIVNIPLSGNPIINASSLLGMCDFDQFLEALASQQVTAVVSGTYSGINFNAQGPVTTAPLSVVITIKPS